MIKKCILLGLYSPIVDKTLVDGLRKYGYDLITFNDFYFHYPWLKNPDMLFNIHVQDDYSMFHKQGRWINWEKYYNEAKCSIVVKRYYPKLNQDKLILYPTNEMIDKFGKNTFTCQAVYCLAYLADKLDYKEILMMGFHCLGNPDEYIFQIPAIVNIMEQLRNKYDVKIECSMEREWRKFLLKIDKDYNNLPNIEHVYE